MLTPDALCLPTDTIAPMPWTAVDLQPLRQFLVHQRIPKQEWPVLSPVTALQLPAPYDFLLTQPLMTVGITEYYQRTPKIRTPLYAIQENAQQTFARAIVMIIDRDSQRNNALIADPLGEAELVELGLIQMNLAVLSKPLVDNLRHSQVPFGALLVDYQMKTRPDRTHYFKVVGNALAPYLAHNNQVVLYGRANTLICEKSGQWLARTVEILTGIKESDVSRSERSRTPAFSSIPST